MLPQWPQVAFCTWSSTNRSIAATIQWTIREVVAKIAHIVFVWYAGQDLVCNVKRWRITADVSNDAGKRILVRPVNCIVKAFWLSCLRHCADHISLLLRAVGVFWRRLQAQQVWSIQPESNMKCVGGTARTAILQYLALDDNYTDLSVKIGSQVGSTSNKLMLCRMSRVDWLVWASVCGLRVLLRVQHWCG